MLKPVRSVIAVVIGYAATAGVIIGGFTFLETNNPAVHHSAAGLAALVTIACVGGVVGGFVAATLAPAKRRLHALLLGVLMLGLGLGIALATGPQSPGEPAWYRFGLPILALPCALIGGRLRSRT